MAEMVITFKAHWVNRGWYRAFTDPYVDIDGALTKCSWTAPTTIRVEPGPRPVCTFVRFRKWLPDGGHVTRVIPVPSTGTVHVVATNWLTNQSPFIPRVADAAADPFA